MRLEIFSIKSESRATRKNSAATWPGRNACYAANETAQRANAAPFHASEDSWYCPVIVKNKPATEHANATALPKSTRPFLFMVATPSFGNVLFSAAIKPQRSAGFWNSDDTNRVAYSRLEVKGIGLKNFLPPKLNTN